MSTLPIGFIAIVIVTYLSLGASDTSVYLNQHSFIIVCIGSVAICVLANPRKDIVLMFKSIKDLFKTDEDEKALKEVLINLSNGKKDIKVNSLPLVDYALNLWEQGVEKNDFENLMYEKLENLNRMSERPVHILKNLSKYPPALGMTGTVMGMISLFANLTGDNKGEIGQALAVAMTATFYGLIIANMILLPLSDRIHIKHLSVSNRNETILDALLKINNKQPSSMIENINLEQEYFEHAG